MCKYCLKLEYCVGVWEIENVENSKAVYHDESITISVLDNAIIFFANDDDLCLNFRIFQFEDQNQLNMIPIF